MIKWDDYRRVFILVILVILCLSLVLQTIGFVTPGWRVTENVMSNVLEMRLGLWYVRACADDNCDTYLLQTYDDKYPSDMNYSNYMLEYEIMTSIALAGCLVAILAVITWHNSRADPLGPIYVCFTVAIVSGVLCLVSSIKMGSVQRDEHDDLKDSPWGSPFKVPYSIILTGIGGILMVTVIVLCFLIQCLFLGYNKPRIEYMYREKQIWSTKSVEPEYIPVENIQPYNLQTESESGHYTNGLPIVVVDSPRDTAMPTSAQRYVQTPAVSHNAPDRIHVPGDVMHVQYDTNRLEDSYYLP